MEIFFTFSVWRLVLWPCSLAHFANAVFLDIRVLGSQYFFVSIMYCLILLLPNLFILYLFFF